MAYFSPTSFLFLQGDGPTWWGRDHSRYDKRGKQTHEKVTEVAFLDEPWGD